MATTPQAEPLLKLLRETITVLVRRDARDLSTRQLCVFLICYLDDGAHTIRGLAAVLNVPKPSITRAVDKLEELHLAVRKTDPLDRRSVLVHRTMKGTAFLRDLKKIMGTAASDAPAYPRADGIRPVRRA
jgi:DNA-binding MarR family transcriptional regulator